MIYAVIAFATAAIGFAGATAALAIRLGGLKAEQRDLQRKVEDLTESRRQITIRDRLIAANEDEIRKLHKLLRDHAPDGVAAGMFDRLLPPKPPDKGT